MSGGISVEFNHIMNQQIRCWSRLRTMDLSHVTLDIDTFVHLSQMPRLSKLSFKLSHALMAQVISTNHLLVFSTLEYFHAATDSIAAASQLLTRVLLPAAAQVLIFFETTPPRHAIKSFLMALARACDRLNSLCVMQFSLFAVHNTKQILTLDDIRPLMAFNLTGIHIDLDRVIQLNDSSLLEFTSSCERLSSLNTNSMFGWRTPGITPAGLAQILHNCQSLISLSIALDTRNYVFSSQIRTSPDGSFLSMNVDVSDSVIEAESIPALAAFFADQVFGRASEISLGSWNSYSMCRRVPEADVYKERWKEVEKLAQQMTMERRPSGRFLNF